MLHVVDVRGVRAEPPCGHELVHLVPHPDPEEEQPEVQVDSELLDLDHYRERVLLVLVLL